MFGFQDSFSELLSLIFADPSELNCTLVGELGLDQALEYELVDELTGILHNCALLFFLSSFGQLSVENFSKIIPVVRNVLQKLIKKILNYFPEFVKAAYAMNYEDRKMFSGFLCLYLLHLR